MTEKDTHPPDAPLEAGRIPYETLAALELGFKSLLTLLDPTLYPSDATTVPTLKPDSLVTMPRPAAIGRAIRASDLAFPTGNNILDHSPDAPFNMDMEELRNAQPFSGYKVFHGKGLRDIQNPEEYAKTLQGRAKGRANRDITAVLGFGEGVYTLVICDTETRAWLRAHPLFAAQLHTEPHASAFPFRLSEFPGRGTGLVASRLIKKDEYILREPPLLIMIQALTREFVNTFQQSAQHMDPRALRALDALYDCHANDPPKQRIPGAGPRLGKVRTNALGVRFPTTPAGETLGATFEIISRVNHSCEANLDFEWSYKDFQGSLKGLRDIQPGEELTLSYLSNTDAPRETRRAELLKKYRFKCACQKCCPT